MADHDDIAEVLDALPDLEPRECVCGRTLREPASVALGLGPVCRKRLLGDIDVDDRAGAGQLAAFELPEAAGA